MLVLARKVGEKIIVNDDIEIIVLDANQNTVRIGVNAPKNVTVYREELYREIKSANISSNDVSSDLLNTLQGLIGNKSQGTFKNSQFNKVTAKIKK